MRCSFWTTKYTGQDATERHLPSHWPPSINSKDFPRRMAALFGEELFERVGNLLGKSMREIDIIGRIGLAEFLIILPNVALNDAMIGLERLRLLV